MAVVNMRLFPYENLNIHNQLSKMNSCYTSKIPINFYLQFGKNIFHSFKPNDGQYKITYCEYIGLPKDNEKYK